MKLDICDTPSAQDDEFISNKVREFNHSLFKIDVKPLSIYFRDEDNNIVAGLTSKSYWNWLHIDYLWVSQNERKNNLGSKLMQAAEQEALKRGCVGITLDTFSFQALGFYQKLGYSLLGSLQSYCGDQQRHYLEKKIQ